MKKITILLVMFIASLGFSQTDLIESFDGAAPTLIPEGGCTPIGLSISSAQAFTGTNSFEIIANAAGNPWQGAKLVLQGADLELTTNKLVKAHVYSTTAAGILAKVTDGGGPPSAAAAPHGGTGWEELTFNFQNGDDNTAPANGVYTNLIFYPLWGTGGNYSGQGGAECVSNAPITIYVDNIIGTAPSGATCSDGILNQDETDVDCGGVCTACLVPPTTAAPTPPARPAADVLSVVTPAYTDKTPTGVQVFAGASISNYTVASTDDTRLLLTPSPGGGAQFGYFASTSSGFDLTNFTTLHIDVWVENAGAAGSVLTLQLQNFDTTSGVFQHNISTNINVFTDGAGAWIGGDFDLSTFTGSSLARNNIQQVQIIAAGPAFGPTYFTNLYFHKGTTLGTENFDLNEVSIYPNPSQDNWNIKTKNIKMSSIQVFDMLGKNVMTLNPNTVEATIDGSNLKSGLYFAQIKTDSGINSVKLVKQ